MIGEHDLGNTVSSAGGILFILCLILLFAKSKRPFALTYIILSIIGFLILTGITFFTQVSVFDWYQEDQTIEERRDEILENLKESGMISDKEQRSEQQAKEYVDNLKEKGLLVLDENLQSNKTSENEIVEQESEQEIAVKETEKKEDLIVPENYSPIQPTDVYLSYNYANWELNWSRHDSDVKKTLLTLYSDTDGVSPFSWNVDFSRVAFVVLNQNRDVEYPNNTKLFLLDINEYGEITRKEKYNIRGFHACGSKCYAYPVIWLDDERIGYTTYSNENSELENEVLYLKK